MYVITTEATYVLLINKWYLVSLINALWVPTENGLHLKSGSIR